MNNDIKPAGQSVPGNAEPPLSTVPGLTLAAAGNADTQLPSDPGETVSPAAGNATPEPTSPLPQPPKSRLVPRRAFGLGLIAAAVLAGSGLAYYSAQVAKQQAAAALEAGQRVKPQSLPLPGLVNQLHVASGTGAHTLTVNGQANITDSLVLEPSSAPATPATGQLYFDSKTSLLELYNGTRFIPMAAGGNTLITNNNVTNVAGATNITNVTNVSGGGGGVAAPSGTADSIAMFTATNVLGSSLITQNGNNLSTGNGVENVALGSGAGNSAATLQGGTGGISLLTGATSGASGSITVQSGNSTTTASGNVSVDTGNGIVSGTQIEDYSFENGTDGFVFYEGNETITQDCTVAHTGSCSLNITGDDPIGGGSNVFTQQGSNPAFPVVPGHHYFLENFAKAASTSSTISNGIFFEPGNVFLPR